MVLDPYRAGGSISSYANVMNPLPQKDIIDSVSNFPRNFSVKPG